MKFQVRDGTFETNSSSEHTVVLREDNSYVSKNAFKTAIRSAKELSEVLLQNNVVKTTENNKYLPIPSFSNSYFEYGHGFEMLTEWEDKFYYLLASFSSFNDLSLLIDILTEKIPEIDGIITQLDATAFDSSKEDTIYPSFSTWDCIEYSFGNVDHQSRGIITNLIEALKKKDEKFQKMTKKEIFEEIIFNNQFVIVIDSDSSETLYDMLDEQYFVDAGFTHILSYDYIENDDGHYEYDYNLKVIDDIIKERERK